MFTDDQLSRCPATVAGAELLDGDGFVAELGRPRSVKDVVDGVEKVISHPGQPGGPTLPEQDEVIDKHIGMCQGQLVARQYWIDDAIPRFGVLELEPTMPRHHEMRQGSSSGDSVQEEPV